MKKGSATCRATLVATAAALTGILLSVAYLSVSARPVVDGTHIEASAVRVHESNLIMGEGLVSAFFAILGAVFVIRAREAGGRALLFLTGALRGGLLLWQFALHWKPGWYYIMDPADATASSWTLILVGVLQVAAFAWAGAAVGGRSE